MSRVFGDIRQAGYVTRDLRRSLDFMVEKVGIGPWFVAERVAFKECAYRGQPTELELSIALANSGSLQIELIEQIGNTPSIYTEWLARFPEDEVLQHYSSWPTDYDAVCERAKALGHVAIQEGRTARGPFVYFEHAANPAFIYEVTEYTTARRRVFEQIAEAARDWDGADPVRYGWPDPNG